MTAGDPPLQRVFRHPQCAEPNRTTLLPNLQLGMNPHHTVNIPGIIRRVTDLVVIGELAAQGDDAVLNLHGNGVGIDPGVVEECVGNIALYIIVRSTTSAPNKASRFGS